MPNNNQGVKLKYAFSFTEAHPPNLDQSQTFTSIFKCFHQPPSVFIVII